VIVPEILVLPDGRILVWGMDPTLTLCAICREVISVDYTVPAVAADRGILIHGRCLPVNIYEQQLLQHPPTEVFHDD
jgi:hypothetical protein